MAPKQSSVVEGGLWTGLANRAGHHAGRFIAKTIVGIPFVRQLIGQHPDEAKFFSEAAATGTEILEIPGNNFVIKFVNRTVESSVSEFAELISEFQKNPDENGEAAKKLKAAVEKKFTDELSKKVRILGSMYSSENCPHGLPNTAPLSLTRLQAMEASLRPMNCGCYGITADEVKPTEMPRVLSLIELVYELRAKNPNDADAFWASYRNDVDSLTRAKVLQVFGPGKGGTLQKLEIIASLPHEEWSMALDTMIGAPNEKIEGILRTIIAKVEAGFDRFGKRLGAEKDESKRVLAILHRMLDGICPEKKDESGKVIRHRPAPQGSGWKMVALGLLLASAITVPIIGHYHTKRNGNKTETLEMYNNVR